MIRRKWISIKEQKTLSPHVHRFFSFIFKEDGYVKKLKFESKICLGDFFYPQFDPAKAIPRLDKKFLLQSEKKRKITGWRTGINYVNG